MTGNTEEIAHLIAEGIQLSGSDVEMKDILEVDVNELQNYNGILLGAYTWGDGELPDEFIDFYEDMDGLNLQDKIAAAFGSCDFSYEHVGRAVEILSEKLENLGAKVVNSGLKIEKTPSSADKEICINFGKSFGAAMIKRRDSDEYNSVVS